MKKYWLVFKNSLTSSLEYRSNVLAFFVGEIFSFVVMLYLWFSIYKQGGQLGSYSLAGIILYYAFAKVIMLVIQSQDIAWEIGDTIREGELVSYLLKPINYQWHSFFKNLGQSIFRLMTFSLLLITIIILGFHFANLSWLLILEFVFSLAIGFVMFFLIFYILGVLTFYLGFIQGLNFLTKSIVNFLSGYLIPINLYPDYIARIIELLPFKYIMYIPISVIQGRLSFNDFLREMFFSFIWILILFVFSKFLFNRGLKKYEAFGS